MRYSKLTTFVSAAIFATGLATGVFAAPCAVGSLESYTALGADGCNIGTVQFTNFSLLPPAFTPIAAADVLLTPTAQPGFLVELNASAGAGETLESAFSFFTSGAPLNSGTVGLIGSLVNFDGANTASGSFVPGGTAIAFDIGLDSQLTDTISLMNAAGVLAQLSYVIDGGIDGSASLQQGSVSFAAVPEPSSTLLTFSGFAALAWKGRRRLSPYFRRQQ